MATGTFGTFSLLETNNWSQTQLPSAENLSDASLAVLAALQKLQHDRLTAGWPVGEEAEDMATGVVATLCFVAGSSARLVLASDCCIDVYTADALSQTWPRALICQVIMT